MTNKILVAYASKSGSTAEIAETIGQELKQNGTQVEVHPIKNIKNIQEYKAVVIGGPMIMGWHPGVMAFIERHAEALSQIPVAYFFTSLNLTQTDKNSIGSTLIYLDPSHGATPKNKNKLSFKEKHGLPNNYLEPVLEKVPQVKPVSAAFLAGKLDYSKLPLFGKLFVKIIIRGKEGDFRNWEAVRGWSASLGKLLLQT
jgi:menaquinone-dependent protoporphyrinogen oxidase